MRDSIARVFIVLMTELANEDSSDYYIRACPHCGQFVQLFKAELACCIFRHGVFIGTNEPLPPHASSDLIATWASPTPLFYGCGRPFRFDPITKTLEVCDYI